MVDVTTADGIQLALHLDATTNLPVLITRMGYDTNLGDVTMSAELGDYEEGGGLMLPRSRSNKVDAYPIAEFRATSMTVNGPLGDLVAPGDVASAPRAGPGGQRDRRGTRHGRLVPGRTVAPQRLGGVPDLHRPRRGAAERHADAGRSSPRRVNSCRPSRSAIS